MHGNFNHAFADVRLRSELIRDGQKLPFSTDVGHRLGGVHVNPFNGRQVVEAPHIVSQLLGDEKIKFVFGNLAVNDFSIQLAGYQLSNHSVKDVCDYVTQYITEYSA